MSDALNYLASLEQDPFWQLTAEREGVFIVVMRGHKGAPFEQGFYTMSGGLAGHPMLGRWLREQFSTGRFKLVRGSVPKDDNEG
jgi:hypothetical protein